MVSARGTELASAIFHFLLTDVAMRPAGAKPATALSSTRSTTAKSCIVTSE